VVLLDVLLPDADGFDVLLGLRRSKALNDVPVIMLTGKATREAVLKGMTAGADGYVTKPFEAESLMRAVRTVVGLPEPGNPVKVQDPWSNGDASFWKT
jgi:DNA-binding response OmpR family regulator